MFVLVVILITTLNVQLSFANCASRAPTCEKVFKFIGISKARSNSLSSTEYARRKACLNAYSSVVRYFENYSSCMGKGQSITIDSQKIVKNIKILNKDYYECTLIMDEEIYSSLK